MPVAVSFRFAEADDVSAIVALLVDDSLGAGREISGDLDVYMNAFQEMERQDNNKYLLAIDPDESIIGCVQVTAIAGLSRSGMKRAQLEGIRVLNTARGRGIGALLMSRAHDIALDWGCGLVQLTTDQSREDALRFYERLGYMKSHHGMKFALS